MLFRSIAQEVERLEKELLTYQNEIKRVDKMLSNEGFIAKAPASKIDEEKAKKAKYEELLKKNAKIRAQRAKEAAAKAKVEAEAKAKAEEEKPKKKGKKPQNREFLVVEPIAEETAEVVEEAKDEE